MGWRCAIMLAVLAVILGCKKRQDQSDLTYVKVVFATPPPVPSLAKPPLTSPLINEPLRVGGDVLPPRVVKRVNPVYSDPRGHFRGGVGVFEATITANGDVVDIHVIRSLGPRMDSAFVAALRQWKFRPATLHGQPVAVLFDLTVHIDVH